MAHPDTDFPITIEELNATAWQPYLLNSHGLGCVHYFGELIGQARKAHAAGNDIAHRVFRLLSIVVSYGVELQDLEQPFVPMMSRGDGTKITSGPEDLSEQQRRVLETSTINSQSDEYNARVFDVLWTVEKNYKFALKAIDSYLAAATSQNDNLEWFEKLQRLTRGRILAQKVNKQASVDLILVTLEAIIAANENDPDFPLAHYLETLLYFPRVDVPRYAAKAEQIALSAKAAKNFFDAERFWSLSARWQKQLGDTNSVIRHQIEAAECYVQMAEYQIQLQPPQILLASSWLEQAIEAYRAIPHQRERVIELHRKLLLIQRNTYQEMKTISSAKIDIRKMVSDAEGMVRGYACQDALIRFCAVSSIPTHEEINAIAEDGLKHAPLVNMMRSVVVNQIGRVTARKNPEAGFPQNIDAETKSATEFEHLGNAIALYSRGLVLPALEVIQTEHLVRVCDLEDLFRFSKFIPTNKLKGVAQGYRYFFSGDMFTAASILLPLMESSLRHILESSGEIATNINHELIQDERTLNDILDHPGLGRILGYDVVFNLKGLLVSRHCYNFRNRALHGLMETAEFSSAGILFLLWLWFRLCCHHVVNLYFKQQELWQRQALEAQQTAIAKAAYLIWEERLSTGRRGTAETDWAEAEKVLFNEPLNCS